MQKNSIFKTVLQITLTIFIYSSCGGGTTGTSIIEPKSTIISGSVLNNSEFGSNMEVITDTGTVVQTTTSEDGSFLMTADSPNFIFNIFDSGEAYSKKITLSKDSYFFFTTIDLATFSSTEAEVSLESDCVNQSAESITLGRNCNINFTLRSDTKFSLPVQIINPCTEELIQEDTILNNKPLELNLQEVRCQEVKLTFLNQTSNRAELTIQIVD
jgi:hypothetical protein